MYETYYNLSAKPFRLTPDPSFLFVSAVHKRALAYLRYGLTQGEGFVVITGHVGAGKTTLLKVLLAELGDDVVAAEMVATPMAAKEVIERIGAALGITYEGLHRAAVLQRVEVFLKDRIEEGLRVVLLIDEAQNLTTEALEELRMLTNQQHRGKPYFQVFLVGQNEFRHTLQRADMEQFRQRVIASYHLSPMDAEETEGYVMHRLKRVGWRGDPEFTRDAFAEVHRYAGGIPRRINTLCDRLMLFGFLEERHVIDSEAVRVVSDELLEELRAQGLETVQEDQPEAIASDVAVSSEGVAGQFAALGLAIERMLNQGHREAALEDRVEELEARLSELEARLMKLGPGTVADVPRPSTNDSDLAFDDDHGIEGFDDLPGPDDDPYHGTDR
ncbi:MAG: AAA family ATPase [Gammaproteobacteria bacterium]|nr:XrtA-associated ATPase [Gammaproteobacteria bacterium]MCP5137616.1 AAA family ATPase [Gammaproteobacteria bacterium]